MKVVPDRCGHQLLSEACHQPGPGEGVLMSRHTNAPETQRSEQNMTKGWAAAVGRRGAGLGPSAVLWGLRRLYLSTPARHLPTPSRPECVFDLFTRVSQVSRPLVSPALSFHRWIIDRATDCRLDLARDLVHLVPGLIRTAHWPVLLFRFRIMR